MLKPALECNVFAFLSLTGMLGVLTFTCLCSALPSPPPLTGDQAQTAEEPLAALRARIGHSCSRKCNFMLRVLEGYEHLRLYNSFIEMEFT